MLSSAGWKRGLEVVKEPDVAEGDPAVAAGAVGRKTLLVADDPVHDVERNGMTLRGRRVHCGRRAAFLIVVLRNAGINSVRDVGEDCAGYTISPAPEYAKKVLVPVSDLRLSEVGPEEKGGWGSSEV